MIKPTIGRKVWFRPNGCGSLNGATLNNFDKDQPMDATIVCVHGDRMVNLLVVDHGGAPHMQRSVALRQPDEIAPPGFYCEWVPFQAGQAKAADVVNLPVRDVKQFSVGVERLAAQLPDNAEIMRTIGAKSAAPRVTMDEIEASIASEHYFTAGEGVIGAFAAGQFRVSDADVTLPIGAAHPDLLNPGLNLLTICVLMLHNGTKIVGVNYGAIDPAQHNPVIGKKEARAHAVEQIWPLLGYELRTKLAKAGSTGAAAA